MDKVRSALKSHQSSVDKLSAKKSVMYLGDSGENLHEKSQDKKAKVAQPLVNVGKVSAFETVAISISMHSLEETVRKNQGCFDDEEEAARIPIDNCFHRRQQPPEKSSLL